MNSQTFFKLFDKALSWLNKVLKIRRAETREIS